MPIVVIGDGNWWCPWTLPSVGLDPTGPGAPCRDKLHWLQVSWMTCGRRSADARGAASTDGRRG